MTPDIVTAELLDRIAEQAVELYKTQIELEHCANELTDVAQSRDAWQKQYYEMEEMAQSYHAQRYEAERQLSIANHNADAYLNQYRKLDSEFAEHRKLKSEAEFKVEELSSIAQNYRSEAETARRVAEGYRITQDQWDQTKKERDLANAKATEAAARVASLEEQADERDLTISLLEDQVEELSGPQVPTQLQVDTLEDRVQELLEQNIIQEDQIERQAVTIQKQHHDYAKRVQERDEAQSMFEASQDHLRGAVAKITQLQLKLNEASEERDNYRDQAETLDDYSGFDQELQEQTEQERDAALGQVQELSSAYDKAETLLKKVTEQRDEANRMWAVNRREMGQLRRERDLARDELGRALEEKDEAVSALQQVSKQAGEGDTEQFRLERELTSVIEERDALKKHSKELEVALTDTQTCWNKDQAKLKELQKDLDQVDWDSHNADYWEAQARAATLELANLSIKLANAQQRIQQQRLYIEQLTVNPPYIFTHPTPQELIDDEPQDEEDWQEAAEIDGQGL